MDIDLLEQHIHPAGPSREVAALQRELEMAYRTIRTLERRARKAEAGSAELARAYQLTVANLVKTTSACAMLERERDEWRQRAASHEDGPSMFGGRLALTAAEIGALRKTMARLHHPDAGGDVERMKAWNTLLDTLEQEAR